MTASDASREKGRIDRMAPVNGGEAILRGGKVLGVTSSADIGHTIGRPIVYG